MPHRHHTYTYSHKKYAPLASIHRGFTVFIIDDSVSWLPSYFSLDSF